MTLQALAVFLISWVLPASDREPIRDELPVWEKHPAEQKHLREQAARQNNLRYHFPRSW